MQLLSEKQLPARTGGLLHAISSGDENMMVGGSELRVVPSGPDPLHHNGSPKKPRTPWMLYTDMRPHASWERRFVL